MVAQSGSLAEWLYPCFVVEALILRTWPVHEADQLVSFFTRDLGKLKGIAKSAAKSRKRFGGALEPMTHVLASYAEKPRQELVRLDACEIVASPLSEPVDYGRAAALEFFAEILEETLQDRDPQDAVFRLTVSELEQTRVGRIWLPVTYFGLWMIRLMGWMPEIVRCTECGRPFSGDPAYFEAQRDGLICAEHRHPGARALSPDSLALAARMFREPVESFAEESWPRNRAADLRRFVFQGLERHLERKLRSVQAFRQIA
jgi:DNA repair protein RecO (recombination protein O)